MAPETRSALEIAAAVQRREVTAAEILDQTLQRARADTLGAFAHLTPEYAATQAERIDAQAADPQGPLPRFAGVPVPIKGLNMVKGLPFEAGSAALRGYVAPTTDGIVTLLQEAGTLTVGTTTAPEFGLPAYTEPATGAPARTPWDPRRTAGGSSGGAAVAVATGIVPAAQASDGGGSIRIPAACCGIVGLKPSRGVVSSGPVGVDAFGLVTGGVLTRTVADAAAFLHVISRPWPGDNAPVDFSSPRPGRPLRIGVLTEPLNNDDVVVHRSALDAVERARRVLRDLGHQVGPAPRPMTGADWMAFMPLWTVMSATVPVPAEAEGLLMPLTRYLRERGRGYSAVELAEAVTAVQHLVRRIAVAWAEFDVILTPTLSGPPAFPDELQLADPAADFEAQKRFTPWTSIWNMTGAPAISVPLHRAEVDGMELPFGVQLGGVRPGQDQLLLDLAAQLEWADPWPMFAPGI